MVTLRYNANDKRYVIIDATTRGELSQIERAFNQTPRYMFLPSFRGVPRPVVVVHRATTHDGRQIVYAHSGLWRHIVTFCNEHGIACTPPDKAFYRTGFDVSYDDFKRIVDAWALTPTPREYQIECAYKILHYRQSLSQLATRAGKTLIAYIVFRYMLEYRGAHKVLMVVPNIQLVRQGVEDFASYGAFFTCEQVWAKSEYCASSNLTIGTFQSLVKRCDKRDAKHYDPHFFDAYDVVCVDEAHTLKCESVNAILSQPFMRDALLSFGFSGSLPDSMSIDDLLCTSLMGPKIQDIRSRELMDAGFITPIEIHQLYIKHANDDAFKSTFIACGEYLIGNATGEHLDVDACEFTMCERKTLPRVVEQVKRQSTRDEYITYLTNLLKDNGSQLLMCEQMCLHRDTRRIDEIIALCRDVCVKNTIIFAHHTSYLKHVHRVLCDAFPTRHVYLITGKTSPRKRETICRALIDDKDAILVASYGCVSTGLTFKNLDFGILAQSFKSSIINKQSLGRGLCLANDKEKFVLYDIIDVFPTQRLASQGRVKHKLFVDEKFDVIVETHT